LKTKLASLAPLKRGKQGVDRQDKHTCKTVSISPRNYAEIKKLGKGSFSHGVRVLLDNYLTWKAGLK
jgi:hypothetical protein